MLRHARPAVVTAPAVRITASTTWGRQGASLKGAGKVASVACFPSVVPSLRLRPAASTTWGSPVASTTWGGPVASTTWGSPVASTTWGRVMERRLAA
jgi:hypothetical protein